MKFYRQGDVGIIEIDKLPANLVKKDSVIALGELTGHKHQFRSKQVQVFADESGQQFVEVKQASPLLHEEHDQLEVPKGVYRIAMQRELDLIKQTQKQVLD